jgi:glutamate-1-semialdehyde 2,1-aminomutase
MSAQDPPIDQRWNDTFPRAAGLYRKALEVFPNGVTHDNRFHQPCPIYVDRARGSRKWDVDGREYVDYTMGHGALLLGHAHPTLVRAVADQVARGTHYGACHELELAWGELVIRMIPSAERVRFTASGTEATLMAFRICRAFTGKRKLVKFQGHFHGWHDNAFVGVQPPFDAPSPGILQEVQDSVVLCPPNDSARLEQILSRDPDIGFVVLEPTGAAFGAVPTRPGFLEEVRTITSKHGVLLLFDEVVTGFRCSPGGAQAYYGVTPDLTTLAKILAGGMPGGCVAGRADLMEMLAFHGDPEWDRRRKIPHPGTFNANPVSAAAGIATLKAVEDGAEIARANRMGELLRRRLNDILESRGLPWCAYGLFSFFFLLPGCDGPNAAEEVMAGAYDPGRLKGGDPHLARKFVSAMALNGVHFYGLKGLTSSAHTEEDLDLTARAFDRSLDMLHRERMV